MPSIEDLSIVDSNTATAKKVEHGLERTLCSPELCDSKNLTVYKRTVSKGKQLDLKAGKDYHLVYVMSTAPKGTIIFCNTSGFHRGGFAVGKPRVLATVTYSSPASLASLTERNFSIRDADADGLGAEQRYALS
jgi:hypothetical protein